MTAASRRLSKIHLHSWISHNGIAISFDRISTMKHSHDWKFAATVFSLCILWYASSSAGNILNKLILQRFPYPLTVSMSSLLGTSLYSIPWMSRTQVPRMNLPTGYLLKFVVPLALGKVIAVCLSYFSLWKVPVSYAHTGMSSKFVS